MITVKVSRFWVQKLKTFGQWVCKKLHLDEIWCSLFCQANLER